MLDDLAARASAFLGARCTISLDSSAQPNESLAFPIQTRRGVLGKLTIANPDSNRTYTVDDIHFAVVLADRVAAALENHRLRQCARAG